MNGLISQVLALQNLSSWNVRPRFASRFEAIQPDFGILEAGNMEKREKALFLPNTPPNYKVETGGKMEYINEEKDSQSVNSTGFHRRNLLVRQHFSEEDHFPPPDDDSPSEKEERRLPVLIKQTSLTKKPLFYEVKGDRRGRDKESKVDQESPEIVERSNQNQAVVLPIIAIKPFNDNGSVTSLGVIQSPEELDFSSMKKEPSVQWGSDPVISKAPVIKVTIGRIDVRASFSTIPTPKNTATLKPRMSLEDYLKKRNEKDS